MPGVGWRLLRSIEDLVTGRAWPYSYRVLAG